MPLPHTLQGLTQVTSLELSACFMYGGVEEEEGFAPPKLQGFPSGAFSRALEPLVQVRPELACVAWAGAARCAGSCSALEPARMHLACSPC